uniref:ADP-ribosylation factor-like protein 6 n=1 Tax=Parastrongyloides trichosuri TaxID=131310 RepID=A0A0N4ZXF1_PARTI
MGFFSSIGNLLGFGKRTVHVLVLGLDNSGKTTILNHLKPPEAQSVTVVPTIGYSMEKFTSSNFTFNAFDMSGQSKYRNLWEAHYKNVQGIIFVVDSSDRLRVAVARDELWILLDHKDIMHKKIPILIFSNKVDEKDALTASEVSQSLGLDLIRTRDWHIESCCALTGEGLESGISWLSTNIQKYIEEIETKGGHI